MRCCGDVGAELLGIDLDALFATDACLFRYEQDDDPYGGRLEEWVLTATTKINFSVNRPGEPQREGEKKVPSTAPFVVLSALNVPVRVRDRWRIGGQDYEVLEVEQPGTFDFFYYTYCAAVDQYEPAS